MHGTKIKYLNFGGDRDHHPNPGPDHGNPKVKNRLDFDGDPDHDLDRRSFMLSQPQSRFI